MTPDEKQILRNAQYALRQSVDALIEHDNDKNYETAAGLRDLIGNTIREIKKALGE